MIHSKSEEEAKLRKLWRKLAAKDGVMVTEAVAALAALEKHRDRQEITRAKNRWRGKVRYGQSVGSLPLGEKLPTDSFLRWSGKKCGNLVDYVDIPVKPPGPASHDIGLKHQAVVVPADSAQLGIKFRELTVKNQALEAENQNLRRKLEACERQLAKWGRKQGS